MYPHFHDLINDLLGTDLETPIKTFGMFLAFAFMAAYIPLRFELLRKERLGHFRLRKETIVLQAPMPLHEVGIYTLVWGLVAYKLGYFFVDAAEFSRHTDEVLMSGKGFWLTGLLGMGIAGALKWRAYQQRKGLEVKTQEIMAGPEHYLGVVVTIAFVAGILGSKLFAMLDPGGNFWVNPLQELTSFNGLSFFGGLLSAGILISVYLVRKGFNWFSLLDAFGPPLILAYAVGRIGCQLSGDGDWGIINEAPQPEWLAWLPEWTWHFTYPNNVAYSFPTPMVDCVQGVCNAAVAIPGCEGEFCTELAKPVYPTPFYETMMGLGIFGLLWGLRNKMKYPGMLAGIYLALVGLERFLIEGIRVNEEYDVLGMHLSQAELIALGLIAAGIGVFVYSYRKKMPMVVESPPAS